ncbi:phenylacetate--CoA ligase family protein [Fimbriimonadia bacterium ATM]|nr:MAG: phenylacetate--CoA ligase family protein [Armatimonadota bacterium]MBC6968720.1 phenylacetate--CoA ligase family protein [Armatimonadota bacterium]MCE7899849.1 phenylacetate--CoA ligase family protein [Armatimonadetes bacterium ATM1]MDL1928697.1 phenylacetate--CoA ligase family protein [Fimbriimonadia bacterium ATM]RIJ94366.1 MAG: hypothetical protein DCC45_12730 [Armatimonadota bacterium]
MSIRSVVRKLHDSSPVFVQTAIRSIFASLPDGIRFGRDYTSIKEDIFQSDKASVEQLRSRRDESLQRLIAFACERSEFHAAGMKKAGMSPSDVRGPDSLAALPLMTRDDLHQHNAAIRASNAHDFQPEALTSGGSTGVPVEFLSDRKALLYEKACLARHWMRAGVRDDDKVATLRGLRLKVNPRKPTLRIGKELFVSTYHLSPATIEHVAHEMRKAKVTVLNAYPSMAAFLAKLIRDAGCEPPRIRVVVTSSETLDDSQRAQVREVFGCEVFDYYGLTELVGNAGQCSELGGYHFSEEMGVVEITDDDGVPLPPGTEGNVVLTGLLNYSFPFIRYVTGDIGALSPIPCRCGRPHVTLSHIAGRTADYLLTPTGARLTVAALNMHDSTWDNVLQYQLVQVAEDRVEVTVVPSARFTVEDEKRILAMIAPKLSDFTVSLRSDVEVRRTNRGKCPVIVRDYLVTS